MSKTNFEFTDDIMYLKGIGPRFAEILKKKLTLKYVFDIIIFRHEVILNLIGSSPVKSKTLRHRGVAQLVAHLVWDQRVAGSSPVTPN